jgi:hypothetical protein
VVELWEPLPDPGDRQLPGETPEQQWFWWTEYHMALRRGLSEQQSKLEADRLLTWRLRMIEREGYRNS